MGFVEYKSTEIPTLEPFFCRTGSSSLKFKGFQNLRMKFHNLVFLVMAFGYTTVSTVGASNKSEDYCKVAVDHLTKLSAALTSVNYVDQRVETLNEDVQRLQGDNTVLCETIGANRLGSALLASSSNEALETVGQKCMPENNLKLLLDLEKSSGRRFPLLWDFFIEDVEHRFSLGCIFHFVHLLSTEENRVQLYTQFLEIMSLEVAKNHSAWGEVIIKLTHDLHKYPDLAELRSSVPAGLNEVFTSGEKSLKPLNVTGWLTISSTGCAEHSNTLICNISPMKTGSASCHQPQCLQSLSNLLKPRQWSVEAFEHPYFVQFIHGPSNQTFGRYNGSRVHNELLASPSPNEENVDESVYHWKLVAHIEADQTVSYKLLNRAFPEDALCAHDDGSVTIEHLSSSDEDGHGSCVWQIS